MAHPSTLETGQKSSSFANVWPIAFQPTEAEEESLTALAEADVGSRYIWQGVPQKVDIEPERRE